MVQKFSDFGSDIQKLLIPEIVTWTAQQFYESNHCTPWMWSMDHEAFEQHFCGDFLEFARFDLVE